MMSTDAERKRKLDDDSDGDDQMIDDDANDAGTGTGTPTDAVRSFTTTGGWPMAGHGCWPNERG